MSPPIYTPDGSEVSEIVLPDGSTASQVIGPDGNVVFEAEPDIPDSAVFRYLYEDTGDTSTATDEWNGNDGAISGASFETTTPLEGNASLDLGTVDDLYSIDTGVAAATDSSWSVATLVRPSNITTSSDQCIIGVSATENLRDLTTFNSGSDVGVAVRNDSGTFYGAAEATTNLSNGTTYFLVGVYDASAPEIRYYRDGSRIATTDVSGSFTNSSNNWFIGTRDGTINPFAGVVDRSDVYSKALSDSEVSNLNSTGSIYG